MTPADTLRGAATRLRELAEASHKMTPVVGAKLAALLEAIACHWEIRTQDAALSLARSILGEEAESE